MGLCCVREATDCVNLLISRTTLACNSSRQLGVDERWAALGARPAVRVKCFIARLGFYRDEFRQPETRRADLFIPACLGASG